MLELEEGEYRVEARVDNGGQASEEVFVAAGAIQPLHLVPFAAPAMIRIPAGRFLMGNPPARRGRMLRQREARPPGQRAPFELGKYEVTFADWDACVAETVASTSRTMGAGAEAAARSSMSPGTMPRPTSAGSTAQPASLSPAHRGRMGVRRPRRHHHRLLHRRLHPHRPGQLRRQLRLQRLRRQDRRLPEQTSPAGSYPAQPLGPLEMHGNAWEWVKTAGTTTTGAPDEVAAAPGRDGDCARRVLRGGSWDVTPRGSALGLPQRGRHRRPEQPPRFPLGQDAYTLILFFFTSWGSRGA